MALWRLLAHPHPVPDDFGATAPTERLFVRFGFFVYNTTGTEPNLARGRLHVDVRPIPNGGITGGPALSASSGDTTSWQFTPLTSTYQTGTFGTARISWEMASNSGECVSKPAYQLSDDGVTWLAPVAIGATTRSSDGITYGTGFAAVTLTAGRLVRFGLLVQNASGSELHSCSSTIRVDWRN